MSEFNAKTIEEIIAKHGQGTASRLIVKLAHEHAMDILADKLDLIETHRPEEYASSTGMLYRRTETGYQLVIRR